MARTSRALERGTSRRSFLVRTALVGSAVVLAPLRYLLQPGTAYAVVCGDCGGGACCDGYSEFCCVIYGENACPPGTFSGGWWKADGSGYCGGQARYYVDCHAECRKCGCTNGSAFCKGDCVDCACGCQSCNNRKGCCTNFRYGQCNQHIACAGPITCRVATCTPPYLWDGSCTSVSATDNNTVTHDASCLTAELARPWSGWAGLGGVLTSAPAVAAPGNNRLDVFARGADNEIWHRSWNGGRWVEWVSVGAPPNPPLSNGSSTVSAPAAVSVSEGTIDLFVTGPLNALWHRHYNGRRWSDWESRGGNLSSAPTAASWASDRIDVFARGSSGDVQQATADSGIWGPWGSLGGQIIGAPAATSWGPNRVDLFAHGVDDGVWHRWWGGQWSPWAGLGGRVKGGLDAAAMQPDRIDVFARGADDVLYQKSWDGMRWVDWAKRGGILRDDPAAVSWGPGRIDVFVRGANDGLWHSYRN
jgi:hypothetical protein